MCTKYSKTVCVSIRLGVTEEFFFYRNSKLYIFQLYYYSFINSLSFVLSCFPICDIFFFDLLCLLYGVLYLRIFFVNVMFLFLLLSFLFVGNTIQLIGVNVTFLGLRFRRWFHLILCLPCSVCEVYYFLLSISRQRTVTGSFGGDSYFFLWLIGWRNLASWNLKRENLMDLWGFLISLTIS